jgi:pimeloyl-ACP methyl ester carboxylesterase
VIASLAQNYRVIAFDARGSGKSDRPHNVEAYGPEMGLDVIRLMDHLGINRAHIIGYSMGAHITAQLLTTHSERFISVTLGGAAGRFRWAEEDIASRTVTEPAERERECVSRTQIFRLASTDAPKPDEESIKKQSEACFANPDIDRFAIAARTRAERAYVITPAQLQRVDLPMLGIVGNLDPYLADFNELKKLRPDMNLVIVDLATHGTAMQRPEFVAAVLEFIASIGAVSSQ